jgi:hypothetical protein
MELSIKQILRVTMPTITMATMLNQMIFRGKTHTARTMEETTRMELMTIAMVVMLIITTMRRTRTLILRQEVPMTIIGRTLIRTTTKHIRPLRTVTMTIMKTDMAVAHRQLEVSMIIVVRTTIAPVITLHLQMCLTSIPLRTMH